MRRAEVNEPKVPWRRGLLLLVLGAVVGYVFNRWLLGCSADEFAASYDASADVLEDARDASADVLVDVAQLDAGDGDTVLAPDAAGDAGDAGDGSADACGIGKLTKLPCFSPTSGNECLHLNDAGKFAFTCDGANGGNCYATGEAVVLCTEAADCPSGFPHCCYYGAAAGGSCPVLLEDGGPIFNTGGHGGFAGTSCQASCESHGFLTVCADDAPCTNGTHCKAVMPVPLNANPPSFGVCL